MKIEFSVSRSSEGVIEMKFLSFVRKEANNKFVVTPFSISEQIFPWGRNHLFISRGAGGRALSRKKESICAKTCAFRKLVIRRYDFVFYYTLQILSSKRVHFNQLIASYKNNQNFSTNRKRINGIPSGQMNSSCLSSAKLSPNPRLARTKKF